MSVKCGSCKDKHETVNDVRDCYAQAQYDEEQAKAEAEMERRSERWFEERGGAVDDPREREAWAREDMMRADHQDDLISALEASVREKRYIDESEEERAAALLDGMTGSPGRDMASKAQVDYAMDLLAGRIWPDSLTRSDVENMERRQVSKLIDGLKRAKPKAGAKTVLQADDWKDIPAGRYALYSPSHENGAHQSHWRFYQVDFPTKPMWKGRVFVSQLFGAPGDYRKEPRRGDAARAILEAIAGDPNKAMTDFGLQSGTCGKCNSPLTNEESLARGIGPVCLRKMGWG